jgi:hypothetical protein
MTTTPKITDSSKRALDFIILLRLVVVCLGEKTRKAWWGTDLLGTCVRFLENVFQMTAWNAALTSTCEAARIVHDQSIGLSRSCHLFRLPPDIESIVEGSLRMTDFKGHRAPPTPRRNDPKRRMRRSSLNSSKEEPNT